MAFSQPLWEVNTGGDDTNNGGGFDVNCTFPTDGAATSATGTAPVFSSASYNFVANDVGHWIFIKSGTNWNPGWYKITAVASNNATLNASIGQGVVYLSQRGQIQGPTLIAGCATTASPTGATWGIDYSQKSDGTSYLTFTDMVIQASNTQFRSAGNPVGKNFIGNIISVTSGTGFTVQRVRVTSTATITATCDKSLGTVGSTGGNGRMGGAFKSPAMPFSLVVSGNDGIYIRSGSYTISSTSTNVANGCIATAGNYRCEGYASVRGDLGTAPVLTASGISTATLVSFASGSTFVRNLTVDGASLTAIRCFDFGSGAATVAYLLAKNATNTGINSASSSLFNAYRCGATGCTTAGAGFSIAGGCFTACESWGNSVSGFANVTLRATFINCLSAGNTGATSDGFSTTMTDNFTNCTSYGNGRDGFRIASGNGPLFINCIAEGNGGFGWGSASSALQNVYFTNCGTYNNTSGSTNNPKGFDTPFIGMAFDSIVVGSTSFFTNAAGGDFSLPSNSPLRARGYPGLFPRGTTTGYIDIGAAQAPYYAPGFGGNYGSSG